MNRVRRIRAANGRCFVVKQARPAPDRFPGYRVSNQQIVFEARCYETVAGLDATGVCPRIHEIALAAVESGRGLVNEPPDDPAEPLRGTR